jgi:signal peptidase II
MAGASPVRPRREAKPLKRSMLVLAGGIFVITTVLDWVTKILAEAHLAGTPIHVVPGWASLRLAYNRGVAFSAFDNMPHWVLGIGAIVLLGFVVWGLRSIADKPAGAIALSLVVAGGLNNAIDRLIDGQVTDMISVWRWPVFNIADTAITIGVVLLFFATKKEKKAGPVAAAAEGPGQAA